MQEQRVHGGGSYRRHSVASLERAKLVLTGYTKGAIETIYEVDVQILHTNALRMIPVVTAMNIAQKHGFRINAS